MDVQDQTRARLHQGNADLESHRPGTLTHSRMSTQQPLSPLAHVIPHTLPVPLVRQVTVVETDAQTSFHRALRERFK